MYEKNLTEDLRLRLSKTDMDFLRNLSAKRAVTISECIRSIIGEYRRSIEAMEIFSQAIAMAKDKEAQLSNGDTKTNINNQL